MTGSAPRSPRHFGSAGVILACDGSTRQAVAALVDPAGVVLGAWRDTPGARGTAGLALGVSSLLEQAGLAPARLAGVVVGTGPGSYTGLRAAIAFARALAFGAGLPLVGWPSVASAAAACLARDPALGQVITLVEAHRRQRYRADYVPGGSGSVAQTRAPCLVPESRARELLTVGEAGRVVLEDPAPDASWLARLARPRLVAGGEPPARVLPLYLKPSHAEINLAARRG